MTSVWFCLTVENIESLHEIYYFYQMFVANHWEYEFEKLFVATVAFNSVDNVTVPSIDTNPNKESMLQSFDNMTKIKWHIGRFHLISAFLLQKDRNMISS